MFENIIGHEDKKKILEKCIKSGNISHAYLFSGKKGVGKRTLAEEFARQILNVKNLESSADYKYISKRDDKTSNWGFSIIQSRDIFIDKTADIYNDYILIQRPGRYIIQFFYLNNKDYPFIHREFLVQ